VRKIILNITGFDFESSHAVHYQITLKHSLPTWYILSLNVHLSVLFAGSQRRWEIKRKRNAAEDFPTFSSTNNILLLQL